MIEIINYTKIIRGASVLKNINLKLNRGMIYGLSGKNGSGKTMLMRAICGLIRPTEGKIIIDGETLGEKISFPKSVGVLIENPDFLDSETAFSNLKLLASIKKIATDVDIKDSLSAVGLDPDDKRKYRKFSLGMKQKLGIAAAIMEKPEILILDEPLNALDQDGVERVRQILKDFKERGSTVILACHDREELELLSDEIIKIESGAIVP